MSEKEITSCDFAPVLGYEGLYEVSRSGEVRSVDRWINRIKYSDLVFRKGKILLPHQDCSNGYVRYNLCLNGKHKSLYAHRLVAQAFIPNPDNKPQVNHKDGKKHNNTSENLEWATSSENMFHSADLGLRKVYPVDCFNINGEFIKTYKSVRSIHEELKIEPVRIYEMVNFKKRRPKQIKGFVFKKSPSKI